MGVTTKDRRLSYKTNKARLREKMESILPGVCCLPPVLPGQGTLETHPTSTASWSWPSHLGMVRGEQGMGPEAGPLELSVAQVNTSSDGTGSNLGPGYTHPCP